MNLDELRDARTAEPFKAFTINLADGRRFLVPHPEFLAVPPTGRRSSFVVFTPRENDQDSTKFDIIDPTLVTSLSFDGPDAKNGAGESRIP